MNPQSKKPDVSIPSRSQNAAFEDGEINIYDIVEPLVTQWKTVLSATILGLLLGIFGWWFKGYEAELNLVPVAPLDFVEWRKITAGLPALAEKRISDTQSDPVKSDLYEMLSKSEWWLKNVSPKYKYSKSDIKELAAISQEAQESGATIIESVAFRVMDVDGSSAAKKVRDVAAYVSEGGLLLSLKSALERDELRERQLAYSLSSKTAKERLELTYLNSRADALDKLLLKYPEKPGASTQTVLDPKDNSSKYLPLSTQLVAVKTEINGIIESLERSRDQLNGAKVTRAFIDKAAVLVGTVSDGFVLADQIGDIIAEIRTGIDPSNQSQLSAINQIAFEFSSINERYNALFESNGLVAIRRPAKALPIALGIIGGLLVGVMFVFVSTAWRRARMERLARF